MISIGILCGGKSKRFGTDKTFYKLGEKTILEIVFERFYEFTDDIFLQLSNNNEERNNKLNFAQNKFFDLIHDKGPLGGIYSALKNAKYDKVFIIAGDLPYIDKNILTELNQYTDQHLIIPKWNNNYVEPLCAVYSKELIPIIENQIDKEILKIHKLYEAIEENHNTIQIKYLSIEKLMDENKIHKDCFKNINCVEDLVR